ncbi:hypothetical protein WKH31_18220 [Metabacillus indicus]|uniref:hypothetical protein n=1 Tax=Metabacillus indicus TaxID=246786 RepID=UPI00316E27B8
MYKIETYAVMPKQHIEDALSTYTAEHFSNYPEICYTNIKNQEVILDLYHNEDIDPRHMDVCIHIKYNDVDILGYNVNGLNLWEDITTSLENLVENTSSNILFGIEPIKLVLEDLGKNSLVFKVVDEFTLKPMYSHILKRDEFIREILKAGIEYYTALVNYNFPRRERIVEKINRLNALEHELI